MLLIFSKMADSNNRKNIDTGKIGIDFRAFVLRNWQNCKVWTKMRQSLG